MRAEVASVAAVLVAVAFAWAGAAKLASPAATKAGFAAMGLPRPEAVALAAPVLELAVAVACLASPKVGGAAAAVLLVVFTALLGRTLGRGVPVVCACFGSASKDPISLLDVARNAGLGALVLASLGADVLEVPGVAACALVGVPAAAGAAALTVARRRRRAARV